MCPACIATTVWIAAGAASAGGVTTLALRRFRSRGDRLDENAGEGVSPERGPRRPSHGGWRNP